MTTLQTTRVNHLGVAQQFARNPREWPIEPRFDPVNRWYACIADDADAQVWLLTWLPGQRTELHDHGGSAGAFVVVSGALTEEAVTVEGGRTHLSEDLMSTGRGRRFGAHHIHRMTNHSRVPAISIHVYGPRLETMTGYRFNDGRLQVAAVERAGVSW